MPPSPSKIIRRVHMYLALFLTPWMLIYALSGLALNHGPAVRALYGAAWGQFEKVEERPYTAAFSEGADNRMIGAQILEHLGLTGTFNVQGAPNQPRLVITRNAAFAAHRITYFRTENRLLVEKQAFSAPVFVNRAHFRHGYAQPFLASKIWAVVVDLAVVGMLFWVTAADLDLLGMDPQYVGWQLSTKFNSGQARVMGAEFSIRHTLRPLGQWGRFFTVFINGTKLQLSGSQQADFAGFIPKNMNWGVTFTKKPVTLIAKWNYRGEQKGAAFPALGPDAYNYTAARTTLDLSGDYQINKRCSLNTNIRNVFNAYLVNTRYGSVTPGYAQPRQYRHFGVYFSAGIKGTF